MRKHGYDPMEFHCRVAQATVNEAHMAEIRRLIPIIREQFRKVAALRKQIAEMEIANDSKN